MFLSFLAENAEKIIAILALVIALQANLLSRRSKLESDRLLLSERKRDLLQVIDHQHVTLMRVRFIIQDQLLQFELCPQISTLMPDERERLVSNLAVLDNLERFCLKARSEAEAVDLKHDPARIDAQFSDVGRLTAHLLKDLEHEQSLLVGKKNLVSTAPDEITKA